MGRTADAIEEGVAIAAAAARLALSNRILVDTIANGERFDGERFATVAQETLLHLADEHEQAAAVLRKQLRKAQRKFSESRGTHDYRNRDKSNLKQRRKQYLGVADVLRRFADDPVQVETLVEQSRDAAWHNVEENILRRLDAEAFDPAADDDYETMREARMESVRMIDLPRLEAHCRRMAALAAEQAERPLQPEEADQPVGVEQPEEADELDSVA